MLQIIITYTCLSNGAPGVLCDNVSRRIISDFIFCEQAYQHAWSPLLADVETLDSRLHPDTDTDTDMRKEMKHIDLVLKKMTWVARMGNATVKVPESISEIINKTTFFTVNF